MNNINKTNTNTVSKNNSRIFEYILFEDLYRIYANNTRNTSSIRACKISVQRVLFYKEK